MAEKRLRFASKLKAVIDIDKNDDGIFDRIKKMSKLAERNPALEYKKIAAINTLEKYKKLLNVSDFDNAAEIGVGAHKILDSVRRQILKVYHSHQKKLNGGSL